MMFCLFLFFEYHNYMMNIHLHHILIMRLGVACYIDIILQYIFFYAIIYI